MGKRLFEKIYEKFFLFSHCRKLQKKYLKELKKRDVANVVFLPMNVSMWKYQHIYEALKKDPRFKIYVFLSPATTYAREERIKDLQAMRKYFDERGVDYVDYELEKDKPVVDILSVVDPDILFYSQPYERVMEKPHRFIRFEKKLLCYSPYSFLPRTMPMFFNDLFTKMAWKLYYQTEENLRVARRIADTHGKNVVVAGYTSADDFALPLQNDVWKIKDRSVKRVIWAPHFTVNPGRGYYPASYFLEMAQFMKDAVELYAGKVLFAFKPHPRLYSELCIHPKWGEQRAKDYYDFWQNNPYTQLETGDFVDLFKGSDAMIHDSGSFVVDYLFFNKPVLYDHPNIEGIKSTADNVGKKAYDLHYHLKSMEDIDKFLEQVVIGGQDYMRVQRSEFYERFLKPSGDKTVAEFIHNDIVQSIWG